MWHSLRHLLFGCVCLVFAALTPAQKYIAHVNPPQTYGYQRGGSEQGWGGGYPSWGGGGYGRHWGGRSRDSQYAEPQIGYAHGDPDPIPSTYMDYDKALALGRDIQEHRSAGSTEPSLGDVARALRQGSHPATADGKPLSAVQDRNGKWVICRDGDDRCQ
ncbi:MAG: hypothetical protein WAK48_23495 [Candidatus Acidiferrum sp.]